MTWTENGSRLNSKSRFKSCRLHHFMHFYWYYIIPILCLNNQPFFIQLSTVCSFSLCVVTKWSNLKTAEALAKWLYKGVFQVRQSNLFTIWKKKKKKKLMVFSVYKHKAGTMRNDEAFLWLKTWLYLSVEDDYCVLCFYGNTVQRFQAGLETSCQLNYWIL